MLFCSTAEGCIDVEVEGSPTKVSRLFSYLIQIEKEGFK